MNHFEIFELAVQFELDASSLSAKYRELQLKFHPDNYATASEVEKRLALQKSAQINDAYQTLMDPVRRAEHLLELKGLALKGEQESMRDMDFLMQQMELREKLERIELNSDQTALFDFSDQVNDLYKARLTSLSHEISQDAWQKAADSVLKIKFIAKLQNEIERIEERLF